MKTRIYIITLLVVAVSSVLEAQVGINQEDPTAALEIKGGASGRPLLQLEPQSTPRGLEFGQLAIIDDKMYLFDENRTKWLSLENTLINYGLAGNSDGQELEYVGDVEQSGPKMPFDGTIVHVTMNASSGNDSKSVQLYKNNVVVPNNDINTEVDGVLTLQDFSFINANYNLDFEAGDAFRMVVSASGNPVRDLSVVFWIKWRKDNPN